MGCDCLELLGVGVLVLIAAKAISGLWSFLYTTYLGAFLGHNVDIRKYGQWAIVTGCTDGIGKAYTYKFASLGLNLVLISRTKSKLEELAKDLEQQHKIETKIIAVDFTRDDIYETIGKQITGLDIGVLYNNVGMSYGYPEYFDSIPNGDQITMELINCNITSVARMTRLVLPQMIQKQKGVIVNISSLSAAVPAPLLSLYAASKAFVDKFTQDIGFECRRHPDIVVQGVLPGFVVTKMPGLKRSSVSAPWPKDYVECQLRTLGLETRTAGYWFHKLQLYWSSVALLVLPTLLESISFKTLFRSREKARNKNKVQ